MDFCLNRIKDYINNMWGIIVTDICEINIGSAKCFKIETKNENYFFKIYQDKFGYQEIMKEIEVCQFLSAKGFPVSSFVINKEKKYIGKLSGYLCSIQKYIDGLIFNKFELPNHLLLASARKLAQINVALKDIPFLIPARFDSGWIQEWSKIKYINSYNKLLDLLPKTDENYNKIAQDFRLKQRLIENFDLNRFHFSNMTFCNTHGDYNVLQIIYNANDIKAIVDFANCSKLPISWEIIRSYSCSSVECKDGVIDIDNFVLYVKEYTKIKQLKKEDIIYMPYFYLFTLIRSTFGYKTYILKSNVKDEISEKDLKTLEFAFWRTQMCDWLNNNADLLSEKLINEIGY